MKDSRALPTCISEVLWLQINLVLSTEACGVRGHGSRLYLGVCEKPQDNSSLAQLCGAADSSGCRITAIASHHYKEEKIQHGYETLVSVY
ncbi:hypothetical protein AV530_004106 [Patagioenas fasciata monilis]|uniref:Uncharacterized protein n=1 Tax=Patagioenas fasciata monilis TaxID=372326 RepID=A0A1V4JR18_PATFA|nr:hypothetical protein AV530_004106 [Patagioenas fasciata monilis]